MTKKEKAEILKLLKNHYKSVQKKINEGEIKKIEDIARAEGYIDGICVAISIFM